MEQSEIKKILVMPFVLTILIAALLLLLDSTLGNNGENLNMDSQIQLIIALLLMWMAAIYFFTISFVVPLYYALRKWCQNRWLALVLFNVIGFAFVATIDYFFITYFYLKAIYCIYPLFSLLMLIRFGNSRVVKEA